MKKQIRLLVENLFDDEFDNIYNDTDLDCYISNFRTFDVMFINLFVKIK